MIGSGVDVHMLGKPKVIAGAAAVAVLAGAAVVTAAASGATNGGLDRKDLQRDVNAVHAAGVTGVLAEARSGDRHVAVRSGVADPASRRPVPYDAYFRMGSITKTF